MTPVTCTGRHGDEGGDCAPSCHEIMSCHVTPCCHVVSCHVPTSTWTGGWAGGEAQCSRWRPRWRLRRRRRGQTGSSSSPPRRRRRGTPAPAMLLIDALLCPLLTAKLSSRDQKIESRFVFHLFAFKSYPGRGLAWRRPTSAMRRNPPLCLFAILILSGKGQQVPTAQ